ncbi:MAG: right-handed parallel beta-helix repeat-containing protein [Sedimentisphaerales bacterium]|nr:right-handed parallel beta-helix repeat-containing protein [Sedimentisphaerales bacterium]
MRVNYSFTRRIMIAVLLFCSACCTRQKVVSLHAAESAFVSAAESGSRDGIFYVAVNGSDSWSGRLPNANSQRTDGPFATLEAACKAARRGDTERRRTIVIQGGQYFFDEPLVLTGRDAGLTIESEQGAKACIYGGRKVSGWKRDGEKFYSADLSGVKDGSWDFRALVVNGRFCPRARLPEKGYFEHLSSFNVPWMSSTGGGWKRKPTEEELTTLKYRSEDLGPWLDINNAEVTVYHMWDESMVGVRRMDSDSNTLTFTTPAGHPPGAFGVKRYVIYNVREGMTKPGQWYLDRSAGKVVYRPVAGEDMAKAEVIAPTIESIIRIEGTRDRPVEDITIKGLTLSVTTTPLRAGGFGAGRFEGAVNITSANNCRLIDLEIVNVGGQGIKASGNNLLVEYCHVHHTGACGIRCSGTGCVVSDNHIHDVGLTYPSAIAMQGGGKECRIIHNEIHETPYTAVNCGGQNNRIENNLIYHAMQELHDGAGIYCFAGNGLILRGNFIRDIIDTGGYGASAYYLDERSENCLVEGNLSVGIARPSHNHMAQRNTIRNNVFISDGDARLTFPKSSDYTVEKNIICAKDKIVLENIDAISRLENNILFSKAGIVQARKLKNYSASDTYQLKPEAGNLFHDPLIVEFGRGTVKLAPDSPVTRLGIKLIDVSGAGRRNRRNDLQKSD